MKRLFFFLLSVLALGSASANTGFDGTYTFTVGDKLRFYDSEYSKLIEVAPCFLAGKTCIISEIEKLSKDRVKIVFLVENQQYTYYLSLANIISIHEDNRCFEIDASNSQGQSLFIQSFSDNFIIFAVTDM